MYTSTDNKHVQGRGRHSTGYEEIKRKYRKEETSATSAAEGKIKPKNGEPTYQSRTVDLAGGGAQFGGTAQALREKYEEKGCNDAHKDRSSPKKISIFERFIVWCQNVKDSLYCNWYEFWGHNCCLASAEAKGGWIDKAADRRERLNINNQKLAVHDQAKMAEAAWARDEYGHAIQHGAQAATAGTRVLVANLKQQLN